MGGWVVFFFLRMLLGEEGEEGGEGGGGEFLFGRVGGWMNKKVDRKEK